MYKIIALFSFIFSIKASAQETPFIKLVEINKPINIVAAARQFIIGSTCKSCTVTINDTAVKVYSTGAFVYELKLKPGDTSIAIIAKNNIGRQIAKSIGYSYTPPKPAEPVKILDVESIQTLPEGNLILMAGDKIQFKVKALTGCNVTTISNTPLYEMPLSFANGMAGIYQGEYIVKPTDNFATQKILVAVKNKEGQQIIKETKFNFAIQNPQSSNVCFTKGRLAHLLYGLGEDRLGGAKIGYIDSAIPLKIIGKVGSNFKIALTPNKTAYIPDDVVTLAPLGSFAGQALTDRWQVYGDSNYDYVTIGLTNKLPYQSMQQINPSTIIIDVFGATNNTNWITQLQSTKEIKDVSYEQYQDDIFRITITLKHSQHWGHSIYYKGNILVIKIKQPPTNLALKNLVIAVDAGHGGSNTGAGGPTGSSEKNLTLAIALKLQQTLVANGATVQMTRAVEQFVDNKERILIFRDSKPDLLISIHLNSASDPIRAGGTSSLYKHVGFKNLSYHINKRMMQLGLKEYGHIGAFNFMLNSPTEYPNALVETLFLSNPAEEELVLDPIFQQKIADKIVEGIKDFLKELE